MLISAGMKFSDAALSWLDTRSFSPVAQSSCHGATWRSPEVPISHACEVLRPGVRTKKQGLDRPEEVAQIQFLEWTGARSPETYQVRRTQRRRRSPEGS